jgi:hypothetical protein
MITTGPFAVFVVPLRPSGFPAGPEGARPQNGISPIRSTNSGFSAHKQRYRTSDTCASCLRLCKVKGSFRQPALPHIQQRQHDQALHLFSGAFYAGSQHDSLARCLWVPECRIQSTSVCRRFTRLSETSFPGEQGLFRFTTIPPELSSFRIVATHKLTRNRLGATRRI